MRIRGTVASLCLVAPGFLMGPACLGQTTYYVSPTGSDTANGLTPATAWATAARASQATLGAGDELLFQRGGMWRESLEISAHGTAAAPVIIGAYGKGAAPLFRGSDSLSAGGWTQSATNPDTYYRHFSPQATQYYDYNSGSTVGSVLSNKHFLTSSSLATDSASVATNVNFVHSHANSWYYDGADDRLYVNPASPGELASFEAVTRPIGVEVGGSQHVIVQNLAVDNTARANSSFSVNVVDSNYVTLDSITAARAGKHHFAAIDTDNFVGRNLTATQVMPQLGFGGASSFVSYSSGKRGTNQDSKWINVLSDLSGSSKQPAFVDHGAGLGTVEIIGMQGINSGFSSMGGDLILRDSTFNRAVKINSNGALVQGLQLVGSTGPLHIGGNNVVVENLLVDGTSRMGTSYGAPIVVGGNNASILFSTIDANQTGGGAYSMLAFLPNGGKNLKLVGNVFTSVGSFGVIGGVFAKNTPWKSLISKWNVFPTTGGRFMRTGYGDFLSLEDLQAMGLDQYSSVLGAFPYIIGPDGVYMLDPESGLVDFVPIEQVDFNLLTDVYGNPRGQFGAYDAGAITTSPVPEPTSLLLTAGALGGMALGFRRRRRKSITL